MFGGAVLRAFGFVLLVVVVVVLVVVIRWRRLRHLRATRDDW